MGVLCARHCSNYQHSLSGGQSHEGLAEPQWPHYRQKTVISSSEWRPCSSGQALCPRSLYCSSLPALPVQISGGSSFGPGMAVWLPALQLILDLNTLCYQDLAPRLFKDGKNLFEGTEFPNSVLRWRNRSMWEHGDTKAATGLKGGK